MDEGWEWGAFRISTDKHLLDLPRIHAFLATDSYWATGIPLEVVRRAVEGSLTFGVYQGAEQVGFARVITDYATFGYIADVFVLEAWRGQGVGKWLMQVILAHPDLQGFRRWVLATRDAHGLYQQVGFKPLHSPTSFMEIRVTNAYPSS